jgi:ComF family protein
MITMPGFFEDFIGLFYPELCITCGRKLVTQEKYICLHCLNDLPKTKFQFDPENKVAQLFWGRVRLESASSWLFFRKGSRYQKLVHYLKYKGLKEIGETMGVLFGSELKESPFGMVDIIVPVPLHPQKLKQRGYNQSEWIAQGIAFSMGKPVSVSNLSREIYTSTQTRKNRFERWQNVEGIFTVTHPAEFQGKHILVVDDVITTGSTLEAAAVTLLNAGAGKVSIATLACAEI